MSRVRTTGVDTATRSLFVRIVVHRNFVLELFLQFLDFLFIYILDRFVESDQVKRLIRDWR